MSVFLFWNWIFPSSQDLLLSPFRICWNAFIWFLFRICPLPLQISQFWCWPFWTFYKCILFGIPSIHRGNLRDKRQKVLTSFGWKYQKGAQYHDNFNNFSKYFNVWFRCSRPSVELPQLLFASFCPFRAILDHRNRSILHRYICHICYILKLFFLVSNCWFCHSSVLLVSYFFLPRIVSKT